MKIYEGLENFERLSKAVVTAGTFDGVHLGHQTILERLRKVADSIGGETVLITFWPHPRLVLDPANATIELLTTFEEKAELLASKGLDHLIKIPFTKDFSETSSVDFIKNILVDAIGTKRLVIGYDHRFGHNREGSFESLRENASAYGFEVEEIPRQDLENVGISSSRIRRTLSNGEIHISNQYLGWQFKLTGKVVKGNSLGRQLGFPTANIEKNFAYKLVPSEGAYAVLVDFEGVTYKGMLNIGRRPTISGQALTIEVHIFDFSETIYDREIDIRFVRQIRREIKFPDLEALSNQLAKDRDAALEILQQ